MQTIQIILTTFLFTYFIIFGIALKMYAFDEPPYSTLADRSYRICQKLVLPMLILCIPFYATHGLGWSLLPVTAFLSVMIINARIMPTEEKKPLIVGSRTQIMSKQSHRMMMLAFVLILMSFVTIAAT